MADETVQPDHGRTLLEWSFPEFERHERPFGWYVLAVIVGLALLIWSIVDQNYLFSIIVVLAAALFVRQTTRQPGLITARVMEDGVELGRNFYEYSELKNFWIIYEPPTVKRLFFTFKMGVRPYLAVPIEDQNPVRIREALRNFLPEDTDREAEPVAESLGRMLKL